MINIYTDKEIQIIQKGGRILAEIMRELEKKVKPGITTKYLNEVAEDLIFKYGAEPSFKGFNNYPAALCTSINEEIVHALPSDRKIKQGDILSLDLGIRYKGYCTDLAITVLVEEKKKIPRPDRGRGYGTPFRQRRRVGKLIAVTKKALDIGIAQCKLGNHLQDIGSAIQKYVEKNKFNVVRELCGHGVGKDVHEEPQVLNYKDSSTKLGTKLKSGMVLALEPMVVIGDWHIEKSKDNFSYKTKDNSLSAHFEHTIVITKKGAKILTL